MKCCQCGKFVSVAQATQSLKDRGSSVELSMASLELGENVVVRCQGCSNEFGLPSTSKETDDPLVCTSSSIDDTLCSFNRKLTCVLFPGIVKNDEKAIHCLGGIKGISQVYSQQKKRLGMSYQPDNPFIRKMHADKMKTAGVLLKVRVKKVKTNTGVKRQVMSTNVVGRVNSIYRFESLSEFQYLPIYKDTTEGKYQCLLDKILPCGLYDDPSFLSGQVPPFIVPASFTRSDRPINYAYTTKRYPDRSNSPENDDFHNKLRSDRGVPLAYWWRFNLTEDFPTEPSANSLRIRDAKYEYNKFIRKDFEVLQKMFEERPIWSLNRIRYQSKIRMTSLKVLVPCLGVYMKDGPWKSLWVRYGFDPRKEPSARIYQTLDFRLRHTAGVNSMVTTRDQITHGKSTDRIRASKRKYRDEAPPAEDIPEAACMFREGMVPAQRQIFFQLCDVHLPEVESMLAAEPPPGSTCHEKLGWLLPNAIEDCRDLIFKDVKKTLLFLYNAELKIDDCDEGSSDEDTQNSGDEITNDVDDAMQ